ncbi:hypothetical protein [Streptomyces albofaciens]|uniref:hypothetical protein n=1 Tax=Streptomyces albofaciens TaxID=66866 RepID=UPI000AB6CBF8|nr:hypothetical protein [Streptomyces albofaciens]
MTVHMPVSLTVGDHTGNLGTLSLTPRDNIGVCIADMLRAAAEAFDLAGDGSSDDDAS